MVSSEVAVDLADLEFRASGRLVFDAPYGPVYFYTPGLTIDLLGLRASGSGGAV